MAATPQAIRRDPYFDNARAILITLVVVGHLLESIGMEPGQPLTLWIYSFHMPAFVLISGYLARTYSGTPKQLLRLGTAILFPYIVFQLIHAAARPLFMDKPFHLNFVTPSWTLWFLLALVIWRLLTPLLRSLRFPVLTAVLIAVIAPFEPNLDQAWTMARVLGFLPFYVIGLTLEPRHFDWFRTHIKAWIGYVTLLIGLAGCYLLDPPLKRSDFFFNSNYAEHDPNMLRGLIIRLIALCIGVLGTCAVLAITGRKSNWLTRLGTYSLYVYLLHALVLFPTRYFGALESWDSPLQTVILVLVGITLTVALASPPVVYATRWLISPKWADWFFKPRRSATRSADSQSAQ